MGNYKNINKNWFRNDSITRNEVELGFKTPTNEYRPNMFWFWIDNEPNVENYRFQAADMPKQGISCGYVQDRNFFSDDPDMYFKCFDAALEETKKAGMVMGYCERARIMMSEKFKCDDPDMDGITLGCKISEVKANQEIQLSESFFTVVAKVNADGLLDSDTLTLIPDGLERFSAQGGDYQVFEFYKYSAAYMEGTKANLLCRKASDCAMKVIHEPYIERYKDELGKTLSGHFFDWEGSFGYKLCYSEDLEREFKKRTGDDLRLICPLLIKKDVQGKYMRVRYNRFDTVSELYTEYNFKIPSDKLAEHGMYYLVHLWEEHLLGKAILAGDPMRIYRAVTMPAIDHLGKDYDRVISYKEVQSVCEFDGKRFANEILGCSGWELKPNELRSSINNALSLSVSNFIPHGAYSRRDDITKARYAPDFYDWTPMWEHFKLCADYITRGSYLVSKGQMDANVLLYNPIESIWALLGDHLFDDEILYADKWVYDKPNLASDFEYGDEMTEISDKYLKAVNELTDGHISFLVADKYYLGKMEIHDGKLLLGNRYFESIVLPPIKILTLENAKKLFDFCKSGGYVYSMGCLPKASVERGDNDSEMVKIMTELSNLPCFIKTDESLNGCIGQKGLQSYIQMTDGAFNAKFQKRTIDGHSFYWLSNDTGSIQKAKILFKNQSGRAVKWDIEDGSIKPIPSKDTELGSEISYEFGLSEGFFIEFIPNEKPIAEVDTKDERREYVINGEWNIKFDPNKQPQNPTGYDLNVPDSLYVGIKSELKDWSEFGLGNFSGNIEYETEFILDEDTETIEVKLEDVRYMATVTVDDEYECQKLWSPYNFKFSGNFKKGVHKLHIHVGNLMTNLLMPHRNDGERDYWPMCRPTEEDYRSGLTGAVKILY